MKAVIIDDELKAIKSIEYIVGEYCKNLTIVGIADNINDGIKVVNETKPDIVFLDIELQKGTGFDLLEKIPDRDFNVIFITAYNQYAIKAIKFSAVDYILKPIDIYEFISAVNKVIESRQNGAELDERYDVLFDNLNQNKPAKLAIPTFDGTEYINIADIVRIEAERSYSYIFLTDKRRIVVSKSLIDFEEMLSDNNFFRTHKSYLINLEHVKKHIKHDGGYAEMTDGSKVMISRRKKEEFVNAMRQFLK